MTPLGAVISKETSQLTGGHVGRAKPEVSFGVLESGVIVNVSGNMWVELQRPSTPVRLESSSGCESTLTPTDPEVAHPGGQKRIGSLHESIFRTVPKPSTTVEADDLVICRNEPQRPVLCLATEAQALVGLPALGRVVETNGFAPQSRDPQIAIGGHLEDVPGPGDHRSERGVRDPLTAPEGVQAITGGHPGIQQRGGGTES
jgi:hypothetical protein